MVSWLVAKLGVWIVLAIVGAIVVGGFNLLAKSGGLIRLGVETRKALANAQTEMAQQGAVPNEKFYATNRSAMLKIVLPIVAGSSFIPLSFSRRRYLYSWDRFYYYWRQPWATTVTN
jgi:hypothetical protein